MNIALLTAGGVGSRMHNDIPKQFINIKDKPLILYTMAQFQTHPSIDAIAVVCLDGWHEILKAYAKQYNITKLKWVISGGKNGQESIFNGLTAIKKDCCDKDIVLIHDGNRALVSHDIISDSISTCLKYGSAVAAIPCTEAIFNKASDEDMQSTISIPRDLLVRTQTPHTYILGNILNAHYEAAKRKIENTAASCVLMAELGNVIYFSSGSEKNLKITTNEDLQIFRALLNLEKENN